MKFEHFSEPVISQADYIRRMVRHGGMVIAFLAFSLGLGMTGYRCFGHLSWVDSFLNASMILTGMGPVDPMPSESAKIFSGIYAIYSGVGFLTAIGLFFAPILHRFLHKFHVEE